MFTLKSEFDSIRERMAHLRDHPDLLELEEQVARAQLARLSDELTDILPELCRSDDSQDPPPRSTPMQVHPQADDWDDAEPVSDTRIVALLTWRAAE